MSGDIYAIDQHAAPIGFLEAREDAQQRALARARAAQQGEQLAAIDVEADVVACIDLAVGLGDALDTQERLRGWILPGLDRDQLARMAGHDSWRRRLIASKPASAGGTWACTQDTRAGVPLLSLPSNRLALLPGLDRGPGAHALALHVFGQ